MAASKDSNVLQEYQAMIRMSAENKINTKNTWSLRLIDLLDDILQTQEEGGRTNFQLASSTLNASVQIYGTRVDSVHSDAYKILGGLVSADSIKPSDLFEGQGTKGSGGRHGNKQLASIESTLEPRLEQTTISAFDDVLYPDPVIRRTMGNGEEGTLATSLIVNLENGIETTLMYDSDAIAENDFRRERLFLDSVHALMRGDSKVDEQTFVLAVPSVDLSVFSSVQPTPPPQPKPSLSTVSAKSTSITETVHPVPAVSDLETIDEGMAVDLSDDEDDVIQYGQDFADTDNDNQSFDNQSTPNSQNEKGPDGNPLFRRSTIELAEALAFWDQSEHADENKEDNPQYLLQTPRARRQSVDIDSVMRFALSRTDAENDLLSALSLVKTANQTGYFEDEKDAVEEGMLKDENSDQDSNSDGVNSPSNVARQQEMEKKRALNDLIALQNNVLSSAHSLLEPTHWKGKTKKPVRVAAKATAEDGKAGGKGKKNKKAKKGSKDDGIVKKRTSRQLDFENPVFIPVAAAAKQDQIKQMEKQNKGTDRITCPFAFLKPQRNVFGGNTSTFNLTRFMTRRKGLTQKQNLSITPETFTTLSLFPHPPTIVFPAGAQKSELGDFIPSTDMSSAVRIAEAIAFAQSHNTDTHITSALFPSPALIQRQPRLKDDVSMDRDSRENNEDGFVNEEDKLVEQEGAVEGLVESMNNILSGELMGQQAHRLQDSHHQAENDGEANVPPSGESDDDGFGGDFGGADDDDMDSLPAIHYNLNYELPAQTEATVTVPSLPMFVPETALKNERDTDEIKQIESEITRFTKSLKSDFRMFNVADQSAISKLSLEGMQQAWGLERQLIPQPSQLQTLQIKFEAVPKRVDMHRLKKVIWSALDSDVQVKNAERQQQITRNQENKELALTVKAEEDDTTQFSLTQPSQETSVLILPPTHSFRQSLDSLDGNLPPAQLRDTSVHLAFICLLHLANERNLTLQSGDDGDVVIQTEEEYTEKVELEAAVRRARQSRRRSRHGQN
ncbi:putative Condensin complex subunit 2 [Blattamonas nauphoetae]|uniref:Condensin complex subunit 2 n=1 Tax=Blattamonas nauphoetae TaxID=2049346 RepID=A0ABQ9XJC6_9EUKA|nr:putative Condensin complex subunit 2 [Blattamonas nauphoetae]